MSFFRKLFPKRSPVYTRAKKYFGNRCGLEIGGPSNFFRETGRFPVYKVAESLDGCNFSEETFWVGKTTAGRTYVCGKRKDAGILYICEGNDLSSIPDASYDFLLSSHSLEHFANPAKALMEWRRVIRKEGACVIVLPQNDMVFDRLRPITPLPHLIDDFKSNVGEDDLTHVEEVVSQTDLTAYPKNLADSREALEKLSRDNYLNRCMHHHVFDYDVMKGLADFCGFSIAGFEKAKPYDLTFLLCPK